MAEWSFRSTAGSSYLVDGGRKEYGEPDVHTEITGRTVTPSRGQTARSWMKTAGSDRSPARLGMTAMFRDIDADGDPDLMFAMIRTPDRIWINDGKGNFAR